MLNPHPNPKQAGLAAVLLLILFSAGAYAFIKWQPEEKTALGTSPTPTSTPSASIAPSATPSTSATPSAAAETWKTHTANQRDASYRADYPSTWTAPESGMNFSILDPISANQEKPGGVTGAKIEFGVGTLGDTFETYFETADIGTAKTEVRVNGYQAFRSERTSEWGGGIVITTHIQKHHDGPIVSAVLYIGEGPNADSAKRQAYLDTYQKVLDSFKFTQ